jgi:chaperone BCS1
MGVVLTAFRQGTVLGATALRRRMLVTLEINNKDPTYDWFLKWMAHHQQSTATSGVSTRLMRSHQLSVETAIERRRNGSSSATFNLVAGPGTHYLQFNGAWIQVCRGLASIHPLLTLLTSVPQVKRERETKAVQIVGGATTPWETVTLTTLSRDRTIFPGLLAEARDLAVQENEGKLVIHTAWGTEWRPFGLPRRKRPLQSVVLGEGVSANIEGDIKTFLDRRRWYADRGSWNFVRSRHALTKCCQAYPTAVGTCCTDLQARGNRLSYKRWPVHCPMTYVYLTYQSEAWVTTN